MFRHARLAFRRAPFLMLGDMAGVLAIALMTLTVLNLPALI